MRAGGWIICLSVVVALFGGCTGNDAAITKSRASEPSNATTCATYAKALAASYERLSERHGKHLVGQTRAISRTLHETADDAPASISEEVAVLAEAHDRVADALARADIPTVSPGDDPSELLNALRSQGVYASLETEEAAEANMKVWMACPNLDSEVGEDTMIADGVLAIGGSEADMDEEAQECMGDFFADEIGDNAGCDALYDACGGGDFDACNDLDDFANLGSDYQKFGATCGGVEKPDPIAGLCDLHDERVVGE